MNVTICAIKIFRKASFNCPDGVEEAGLSLRNAKRLINALAAKIIIETKSPLVNTENKQNEKSIVQEKNSILPNFSKLWVSCPPKICNIYYLPLF
jgi:hypothetical protein